MLTDLQIFEVLKKRASLVARSQYAACFVLKGGTVLIAKMFENNRMDLFRRTRDLDIHCDSKDVWNKFCTDCVDILNNNCYGYTYSLIDRRADRKGFDTSDSLKFEVLLATGDVVKIGMDMNIKSNALIGIAFDGYLNMSTYDAYTMLSDKLVVVSSQKVYRRIKDLYDLCVLASLYDFDLTHVQLTLKKKHNKTAGALTNMLIPQNMADLGHAYTKFSGIANKPELDTLLDITVPFLAIIYSGAAGDYTWRKDARQWHLR